jgi:small subunit ribosomal protein S3
MGQKVNPIGLRVGINRGWSSRWYANPKKYASLLHEDIQIRKFINEQVQEGGISLVEIERATDSTDVNIHTAKPGIVIGRQGAGIEKLRANLEKKFQKKFNLNIVEIRKPDLDAAVVAESVASQITRRVNYRRACKMAIRKAMEAGAKGIKIRVAGRLNGVDISREETYKDGNIPLHTFRADISYAHYHAWTTYGVIGIKVWVYTGEIFKTGIRYNDSNKNNKQNNRSK